MSEASEVKLQRTSFNNIKYLLIWTFWKSIPLAQSICKMYNFFFTFSNHIWKQRQIFFLDLLHKEREELRIHHNNGDKDEKEVDLK